MNIFLAENISCGYASRPVLKDVFLSFESGSVFCLLGRNGAGKSTLIKTLAGQLKPLSGTVFCGKDTISLYSTPHSRRAKLVSYVPQEYADSSFSVLDTVVMGRAVYLGLKSSPEKRDYEVALESLAVLQIADFANLRFDQLSGGQKRLVLTARAFAAQTPVMLLDEPDSGLDIANRQLLYSALKACAAAGQVVLFSSHDPGCVHFSDAKILLACNGTVEVCESISVQKLNAVYGTRFAEAVLRGDNAGQVVFVPAK